MAVEQDAPPDRMPCILLEITDVRVERLQSITEADAIAEGASSRPNCYRDGAKGWSMDWSKVGSPSRYTESGYLSEKDVCLVSARLAFGSFLCELHNGPNWNLKPTNIWDENPWVWAINFQRMEPS